MATRNRRRADPRVRLEQLRGKEVTGAADFLTALVAAAVGHGDGRLTPRAAATGAGEKIPSEGGFLVPAEMAADWWQAVYDTGLLLSRTTRLPIARSDRLDVPAVDETSRADGSRFGGVRAYWVDEAETASATKAKFRSMALLPKKLLALAYATESLVNDAPALAAWLRMAFASEAAFAIESAMINGTGAGRPLGVLNADATITVAAVSGQSAATVVAANLENMIARLWGPSRRNAVWLTCNDALAQVEGTSLSNGAPTVTYDADGNPRILGRPVLLDEYTPALGNLGDLVLADFSQFLIGEKEPGIASSIHVRFVYDERVFRFRYSLDGQPAWRTAVTPRNSSTTQSPFVVLAARE